MSVRFNSALLFSILFGIVDVVAQQRETIILKTGWKFSKGEQAQASQKNVDDTAWQTVTVPHDWAIAGPFIKDGDGDTGKLPWKGEGWYRNTNDTGTVSRQTHLPALRWHHGLPYCICKR